MKTAQRTSFAVTLLTTLSALVMAQDATTIYTNGLHAHVDSYKVSHIADGKRDIGSFANISMLVKQEKVKNKATFYSDAGNYFTGPYISSLTKGEAAIGTINTMPFDVISVSNHEFDHGWDSALRQLGKANFPILLGNVYHKESEKPFWNKPCTILEKDGIKIDIVGLHDVFAFNDTISELSLQGLDNDNNNRSDKSSATLENQGTEARGGVKYLQHYIDELRDKTDLIATPAHESVPARQPSIGSTDIRRALDKDIQAVNKVKGLDVLTAGHAHVKTPEPIKVGSTSAPSTDNDGTDIGKLILDVNPTVRAHKVKSFELKTVYTDEWIPDSTTQKVINGQNKRLADLIRQPVGESSITLTHAYGESLQPDSLFTDAMLVAAPTAQIVLVSSGSLRADINAGTITFDDITSTSLFKNELTEMNLSGRDLCNLLKRGASLTDGILQMSKGAEMRYTLQKPAGQCIVSFKINDEEIVDTNIYHVATTTSLALRGDGLLTSKEGKNVQVRAGNSMSNVIIDYFKRGHKIIPAQINEMQVEVSK